MYNNVATVFTRILISIVAVSLVLVAPLRLNAVGLDAHADQTLSVKIIVMLSYVVKDNAVKRMTLNLYTLENF